MEAISRGVEIARTLSETKSVDTLAHQIQLPDYFETLDLKSGKNLFFRGRIAIAPLNPSAPGKGNDDDDLNNWNVHKLVQQTRAWLTKGKMQATRPGVLVLDMTVEKPEVNGKSDLATFLASGYSDIKEGRLKIVLCKSYQKYPSLGSGKIMAGAITLIAKDDNHTQSAAAALQDAEEDLGWISNDESQLLTHFLTHAPASELGMIGQAAENASFISRLCFDPLRQSAKADVRREDGLPFIVTNAGSKKVIFARKDPKWSTPNKLILKQVQYRDSFGFNPTSMLYFDRSKNWIRITAGQESREELVEKLFGFTWLAQAGRERCAPADMMAEANRIAAAAMQYVFTKTDVMSWAPTALAVLRARTNRGWAEDATYKTLCEDFENTFGQRSARDKEMLAKGLATALNASSPHAENLLADHLRISGSAFAPRVNDADMVKSDIDVDAMRASARRSHEHSPDPSQMSNQYIMARYAPNAIASLLAMAGVGFGTEELEDDACRDLASFYSAVFNAGMTGISPSARAQILDDWYVFHCVNIESADHDTQHAATNELIRHIRLAPYRDIKARTLASISNGAFARMEQSVQQQLINVLFSPLDAATRLACVTHCAINNEFEKLRAMIEQFGKDLSESDKGEPTLLVSHTLTDPAHGIDDAPAFTDPEELAKIREDILYSLLLQMHEGLGARMASLVPWICNDAQATAQIANISYALEAAQRGTGPLPAAQHLALSGQAELLPVPYRDAIERYLDKIGSPIAE
ncbi:MAG TPA: hypothetical protein VJ698_13595 [Noviherbaspirillum sp.]|uniref:hypothetical protein n=1 Tax=Noviherbaspirillum sp. TaxID=1926288 RepID=UPI002B477459|nr:hypothetical protein [Noviherbaspirillum sp.]HJV86502.1 hypothetical protein [Noviherbaspirillum sp.]